MRAPGGALPMDARSPNVRNVNVSCTASERARFAEVKPRFFFEFGGAAASRASADADDGAAKAAACLRLTIEVAASVADRGVRDLFHPCVPRAASQRTRTRTLAPRDEGTAAPCVGAGSVH